MTLQDFFPPRPPATPTIYAFAGTHADHAGLPGAAGVTFKQVPWEVRVG